MYSKLRNKSRRYKDQDNEGMISDPIYTED